MPESPDTEAPRWTLRRVGMVAHAGWRRHRLPAVVILLFALLVVGLHVRAYPTLSPIDELQHIDYMVKASRGERVKQGDKVGETAMREEACRGVDADFTPPPCDSPDLRPEQFQEAGYNTASGQFPIYYAVTGAVARVILRAPGIDSIVTAGRLVGALWLAAGAFITWLLMAEFGVRTVTRAAVLGLLMTTPVVLHMSATVNPDSTLLLGGAAMVLATLRWERGAHWGWPVGITVAALLVEKTNILAAALIAIYLAVRGVGALWARRRGESEEILENPSPQRGEAPFRSFALLLGMAAILVVGSLVLTELKSEVQQIGGTNPGLDIPKNRMFRVESLSADQVVSQVPALVTPVSRPPLAEFLSGPGTSVLIRFTDWVLLGAAVGSALWATHRSRVAALGAAVVVTMVVLGPAMALRNYIFGSQFWPIPARFGLTLLPALALLLGVSVVKRSVRVAVTTFSGVAVVYVLGQLVAG